ncbi:CDP-glucose 4,6-dehydratase [Polynucleobacter paneuropaeus]|nr:CDP-glucose 4,6-dehydratase [Polynucleobacter paneuropaeus]MBT8583032.1 CDP-glucose 4,6-dehydratase [Polynucleobacter paneuropaeus]
MTASPNFWRGKQVLLTGHTGFKGAWLAYWLSEMGAKVTGVSLPPNSTPNLFTLIDIAEKATSYFLDIRDAEALSKIVRKSEPEIVFHLAAQALVRPSYKDPLGTFETNVMGTANILNAIRGLDSVKAVVAVTTDKVYKNLERSDPYRETDELGGYDPYSASKSASEMIISSYRDSYFAEQDIGVASARAGNVIGGGDWSEDRLIPDAVRAWDVNLPIYIRRPKAIRPWQHVLEPLNGYLVLAEKLHENGSLAGAYNFGPPAHEVATVQKVIELANQIYGNGTILCSDGTDGPHEAGLLALDASKAKVILDVESRWGLEQTVEKTMSWYLQLKNKVNPHALCDSDITSFLGSREFDES